MTARILFITSAMGLAVWYMLFDVFYMIFSAGSVFSGTVSGLAIAIFFMCGVALFLEGSPELVRRDMDRMRKR